MSEIERWVPSEGMDSLSLFPDLSGPGQTEYVVYSDHLRAVTLAKIEILESLLADEMVPMRHSNGYAVRAVPQVSFLNKIAALRKELGDE